ncbi:UNVERIFIED_CONTAM: hypothetical protein Sradi_1554800 [Sesamum radiatum]|uniref:Uncharacterized protein n=1 Tax=Sesamum radiatum TaxID=300843 RepID=A0AAW2UDA8_SESRA
MSEVCGTLGDIRVAMDDFQECINQTGFIDLSMKGEWFTWNKYSIDHRSLWKRLDRMLVNDGWLKRWPDAFYHSRTPRTSDHLPLVLRGDMQPPQIQPHCWNPDVLGYPKT